MNPHRSSSFIWPNGFCVLCGSVIRVAGSDKEGQDYEWYCSNPKCKHNEGVHRLDDDGPPDIVKTEEGESKDVT